MIVRKLNIYEFYVDYKQEKTPQGIRKGWLDPARLLLPRSYLWYIDNKVRGP
tara:strand:- start:196 stop:351 length:156 start_codon:yes stop_codon:yes gene_type:complete